VGHLFVRRIDDFGTQLRARGDSMGTGGDSRGTGNNAEAPRHLRAGDYWGLAPALHRAAVIEWLYVPGVAIVRQRTMCNRAVQAVEVILLNGTHRDAGFYSNFYGLPVRLARAPRALRGPHASAHYGATLPSLFRFASRIARACARRHRPRGEVRKRPAAGPQVSSGCSRCSIGSVLSGASICLE
jgi:hypothetical protein